MSRQQAEAAGRAAETLAAGHLAAQGWRVLAHRFRSGRGSGAGEIDLIAEKDGIVTFVEVKARPGLAAALESVTPAQQRRLARGAEAWLAAYPAYAGHDCRFDVIVVPADGAIIHLEDAWRPEF